MKKKGMKIRTMKIENGNIENEWVKVEILQQKMKRKMKTSARDE